MMGKEEEMLGLRSDYSSATLPPPDAPGHSAAAVVAAAGLLYDLNCSSYGYSDDIRGLQKHHREELMEFSFCEEEMQVIGNVFEAKEESITEAMVSVEAVVNDAEESKEEDGRTRKKRDAQKEFVVGVMKCKKTDGKEWHCKRDAQPPHSLCSYHLAQLRSYRARYDEEASEGGGRHVNARRKKTAAALGSAAGSNYYYNDSVLGPWWSKRRGSPQGREDLSNDSSESRETVDTSVVDDDDSDDRSVEDEVGSRSEEKKKRKKRPSLKKRGRKPVKARSLKSLL